jgi:two-component system, LytTR family, response regulator
LPGEVPVKIRALIVDDEPPARRNIAALLQREPDIEIIGECGSGKDAVEAIRTLAPDLVFLDVQMPECDGFDALEMLGGKVPGAIVFVTAYDQYALRAPSMPALSIIC